MEDVIKQLIVSGVHLGDDTYAWEYSLIRDIVRQITSNSLLPEYLSFWIQKDNEWQELPWLQFSVGEPYYKENWCNYIKRVAQRVYDYLNYIDNHEILDAEQSDSIPRSKVLVEISIATKKEYMKNIGISSDNHWLQ